MLHPCGLVLDFKLVSSELRGWSCLFHPEVPPGSQPFQQWYSLSSVFRLSVKVEITEEPHGCSALGLVTPRRHQGTGGGGRCLDLAGEVSRGEAAHSRSGKGQPSLLAHTPRGEDAPDTQVLNGNDGTSCWQKLLPGSPHMYDVDSTTFPFTDALVRGEPEYRPGEFLLQEI